MKLDMNAVGYVFQHECSPVLKIYIVFRKSSYITASCSFTNIGTGLHFKSQGTVIGFTYFLSKHFKALNKEQSRFCYATPLVP